MEAKKVSQIDKLQLSDKKYNEKILEIDNKKYNSAGVLIVSKYSGQECIILFKSSLYVSSGINKGKYYCDIPGGGIDIIDSSLEETASRELFEESKKLLLISPKNLKIMKDNNSFLELPGRRLSGKRKAGLFCCFVCKLSHINSKIYNKNKEILKKIKMDSVYYETSELIRIPINNIKEYFKDTKLSDIKKPCEIKDSNNIIQYITVLASKCLYLACVKLINEEIIIKNAIKFTEYKEIFNDLIDSDNKGITIKYF
jgi:hypothetical protein